LQKNFITCFRTYVTFLLSLILLNILENCLLNFLCRYSPGYQPLREWKKFITILGYVRFDASFDCQAKRAVCARVVLFSLISNHLSADLQPDSSLHDRRLCGRSPGRQQRQEQKRPHSASWVTFLFTHLRLPMGLLIHSLADLRLPICVLIHSLPYLCLHMCLLIHLLVC
jgi:hypothetical protein